MTEMASATSSLALRDFGATLIQTRSYTLDKHSAHVMIFMNFDFLFFVRTEPLNYFVHTNKTLLKIGFKMSGVASNKI